MILYSYNFVLVRYAVAIGQILYSNEVATVPQQKDGTIEGGEESRCKSSRQRKGKEERDDQK